MLTNYPLCWPASYPRTARAARDVGQFSVSFARARDDMLAELMRMHAKSIVLSMNVPTRQDGLPYASFREPSDPGVAVWFQHGTKQKVIACDTYAFVLDNLRALGLTITALRAIYRYGATDVLDRMFDGLNALPPDEEAETATAEHEADWWQIFGYQHPNEVNYSDLKKRYREHVARVHPDKGGSAESLIIFNQALLDARQFFGK